MVETARAFEASLGDNVEIAALADLKGVALMAPQDVHDAMRLFDSYGADVLPVVTDQGEVIGTLSEKFIHRRYTDEMEKAQREMFGE
jgi:CIC family chloride channel protein